MVSLDFNKAILAGTPGPTVTLQQLGDVVHLRRVQAVNDADHTRAAALAGNTDDPVSGHWRLGHAMLAFGMARLSIFCGAHAGNDGTFREIASNAARVVVEAGYGVVYGGGRIGLMGAIADAALAAGGEVIGVIPEALASKEVAHTGVTTLHVVDSMHERKSLMVELSDGFIALPGGYGTMDEFHEVLTWRQLRIHDKPIGLLNSHGFYEPLLAQFDRMERDGFLRSYSRELFECEPTIDRLLLKMFG